MPRVKGGYTTRRRRKAVLKMAKGYYGSKNTLYKTANEQVMRSLAYAYRDRKDRKRQFRKLWVTRINAAAMQNGMKYSRFMSGLSKAGIEINRKMLAEMAVNDKEGFKNLVEVAKKNVDKATVKVEENIVVLTRSQIAPANGTPATKKETTAKKEAAPKKETVAKKEATPKAAKEETVKEAAPKKETAPKATKEEAVKEAAPKKAAAKKETAQTEKVERAYASEENLDKIVTKDLPKQAQEIEYGTKKTIASYETEEGVTVEIIINKEDSYCLPCLTVAQLRELASYYGLEAASKLKRDELLAYIDSTANRRPGVQVQVSIDGSTPACLECFTVAKLRDLAKIKGLDGYSAMKKAELLQYIIDYATGKF